MICEYCKKNIADDAVFCSYCGKQIAVILHRNMKSVYDTIVDYFYVLKPNNIDAARYLNPDKKTSMKDIFYQFCLNLQDYNMMPNVIGMLREDRKALFNEILLNYDKDSVLKTYTEDSLYSKLCSVFPVRNQESKQNLWRKYSRGIIDAAKFLGQYGSAKEFNDYIESFNGGLDVVNNMAKSIHGLGLALACNLVKDLGFTNYAKPDTHTKDVITAIGFPGDDVSVIKAIQDIANANGDTAFNLDRMIWLICSGYYFHDNIKIGSHKKELIQRIQGILYV